ncbi:hypothetical protein PHLCEN_2v1919 [Hermanssonia centrifuga]|uniref:Leucine-rich repeat-containing protein n=1 Tax=Hermanssonia centrifuga TaxID=98765 RepID=A0A2R6RVG9_9APHY|nr:hypothetical protein PHLCEN_2v1919 [Hermanssonia centrifuga]
MWFPYIITNGEVDLFSSGALSERILDILRTSEIEFLDLTASLAEEDGLNFKARDMLHVFAKPNSFLFLSEINLNDVRLYDADLMHIHRLPRLGCLSLNNTGISNEGIFLLIPLKRCLVDLDIANNSLIDDDSISAILMLIKLQFIGLYGTAITMDGLRRIASHLKQTRRTMEVDVPEDCEEYIRNHARTELPQQYWLVPASPLISDPTEALRLSSQALEQNLAAFAEFDQELLCDGSKTNMVKRLQDILETRRNDLLVRELVWQDIR